MPTEISWTDETWNPIVGCERCSPGCDRCYAIRVAAREMQPAHVGLTVSIEEPTYHQDHSLGTRLTRDWTGEVRLLPERLGIPLRWRKPRRCFVCSMSDLFHPDVPEEYIDRVFGVMRNADQHTFQVLTKRPQRMAKLRSTYPRLPMPNIWLGTSVENQRYADLRIPHLIATPAAVRFLSVEPLLGPVDLELYLPSIDWVIVGGESGPGARPMHPDWVRDIRDQCVATGVPFHFKQWGEWAPIDESEWPEFGRWVDRVDGKTYGSVAYGRALMSRMGKKLAGRELDGRTWDEFPQPKGTP